MVGDRGGDRGLQHVQPGLGQAPADDHPGERRLAGQEGQPGRPEQGAGEDRAFRLLSDVCADAEQENGEPPVLSGLKNKVRKRDQGFSEKSLGYNGFLQFCKAAAARDHVTLEWDGEYDHYVVRAP